MNSSIIKKLSIITLAALILLGVAGGVAWTQFDRVVANQNEMSATTEALRSQMEADMMHDALRADVLAALRAAANKDSVAAAEVNKDLAEHAGHFREQVAALHAVKLSAKAAAATDDVAAPLENYIKSAESIIGLSAKDITAAEAAMPEFLKTFGVLEGKMSAVSDSIESSQKDVAEKNKALVASFHRILIITVATGIAVLALLTVVIGHSIPGPFRKIIANLVTAANAAKATSAKVAVASQELAAGASQSAASLEETSASLEEITSMIKRTASNSQSAKQLGNETRTAAEAGATDMQSMTLAMSEIKASSDNIAKIIKTIDEIAFQTNLLALNAAVEAARAGEAGMGFAVVADEVRALAQRSAQSAKETTAKIEDSIQKSERGVQISAKVNDSLNEIVTKARQMDELISEVASATSEQSQGIIQINSAIAQMDQVTQGAAAGSNTIATAAEDLSQQSDEIDQGIASFEQLVGKGSQQVAPAPASTPSRTKIKRQAVTKKQTFKPANAARPAPASKPAPNLDSASENLSPSEYGNGKVPAGFTDF